MIPDLNESVLLGQFEKEVLSGKPILIDQLWDSPKALIISLIQKVTKKNVLILTGAAREECHLYHDLPYFFPGSVYDFPAWETLPSEPSPPSPDVVGERYHLLYQWLHAKEPSIILCSLQSCLQHVMTPTSLQSLILEVNKGEEFGFSLLQEHLEAVGYQRRPLAVDKGEYAIRGGIIDIFPVHSPEPFRLEFWGDTVESLRVYDPISQRSIKEILKILITPAQEKELLFKEKTLGSVIDYIGKDCVLVVDDLLALEDRYVSLAEIPGTFSSSFDHFDTFLRDAQQNHQMFYFIPQSREEFGSLECANVPINAHYWRHPFQHLSHLVSSDDICSGEEFLLGLSERSLLQDKTLIFLSSHPSEKGYIQQKIKELNIALPPQTSFEDGYLSSGFSIQDHSMTLIPYAEITKRYKIRRQKQRSTYHNNPLNLSELSPGDIIVHLDHGLGKYLGLETLPNHAGTPTEFLLLGYAENARLFVPLTQSHLVSKYIGGKDGYTPPLHTLGSGRWKRAKAQTERAIVDYASQLIETQAKREMQVGYAFPKGSESLIAFEKEFPFVETEDQLEAIRAVKEDMESPIPMDRLICGDVGYGKTEVAIRAACKAALDGGKQVAVLVPTTVLALQHYETFSERLQRWPLRVGLLSRMQKPKDVKAILEELASGFIDIIIGTHRITSPDVIFRDLGLLIIDEEQRFGVKVKEHLRELKSNVDTLAMSATPIPRTLYMSLSGARDMSVINTPPQDRLPIKTTICEMNDHIIKNALLREFARGGQAYIIHNRIESIYLLADRIQKLVPQAQIVVGHGQMSSEALDSIFHSFKSGKANILIATTIVENGIDVPNANTILVDRADNFGLADLYQLRGRVGRWNRQAYAYFFVPTNRVLAEIAEKRLHALEESNGYGGGMRIALRDLEIRGAGNMLGTEQSGHICAVGFHLYCKLLQQTVEQMQGKGQGIYRHTKIEFPQDARIPDHYVDDPTLRMNLYQRFGELSTLEALTSLLEEVIDRFGKPPQETLWLYHLMRIRIIANSLHITQLKMTGSYLLVKQEKGKQMREEKLRIPLVNNPTEFEAFVTAGLKQTFGTLPT